MTTRTVNYVDLDGNQHDETLMFHINKMDQIRFANAHPNLPAEAKALQEKANALTDDDYDGQSEIMTKFIALIEDIVRAGYGVRQGNKFVRTKEIVESFFDSEAYDEFVAELLTTEGMLISFLRELFPDADFSAVEGV